MSRSFLPIRGQSEAKSNKFSTLIDFRHV